MAGPFALKSGSLVFRGAFRSVGGSLRGGRSEEKKGKACPSRCGLCALRARELSLFFIWAACAAGGKAGPVMGLRPLLGPPCIPPEAPRWGFPASDISRGLRGCRSGSFLATLGDLPARHAMPARAFALTEGVVASCWMVWSSGMAGYCWGKVRFGEGLAEHALQENKAGLEL